MWKQSKQIEIYGTEILQMSICSDEENNIKFIELKYYTCQYVETRQVK